MSSAIGGVVSKSESFIFPHTFFFSFLLWFCFMPKCKHDYEIISSVNTTLTATKTFEFLYSCKLFGGILSVIASNLTCYPTIFFLPVFFWLI